MFNFLLSGGLGELLAPVSHPSYKLYSAIQRHAHSEVDALLQQSPPSAVAAADGSTGTSPLHVAAKAGNAHALQRLLQLGTQQYGQSLTTLLAAQDAQGNTPLHLCAREGHEALVRFLVEQAATASTATGGGAGGVGSGGGSGVVAARNAQGQTAYDLATHHGIRQYLLPISLKQEAEEAERLSALQAPLPPPPTATNAAPAQMCGALSESAHSVARGPIVAPAPAPAPTGATPALLSQPQQLQQQQQLPPQPHHPQPRQQLQQQQHHQQPVQQPQQVSPPSALPPPLQPNDSTTQSQLYQNGSGSGATSSPRVAGAPRRLARPVTHVARGSTDAYVGTQSVQRQPRETAETEHPAGHGQAVVGSAAQLSSEVHVSVSPTAAAAVAQDSKHDIILHSAQTIQPSSGLGGSEENPGPTFAPPLPLTPTLQFTAPAQVANPVQADGFHSSASDPALQAKYGHNKRVLRTAPPPTSTADGSVGQYSMFSSHTSAAVASSQGLSPAVSQNGPRAAPPQFSVAQEGSGSLATTSNSASQPFLPGGPVGPLQRPPTATNGSVARPAPQSQPQLNTQPATITSFDQSVASLTHVQGAGSDSVIEASSHSSSIL